MKQPHFHRIGTLFRTRALIAACAGLMLIGMPQTGRAAETTPAGLMKIRHVVVIYQENWSFDALYGHFPGANGIAHAKSFTQVDVKGRPYKVMPRPWNRGGFDMRFPARMPVAPYDLRKYIRPDERTGDLVHRFYTEQQQIDGGRMDGFMAWSDNPGLVMSYFDATDMPEGRLAQQYVLADNFFHAAFGGSFLNHMFLICACAPRFPHAPGPMVARLDKNGMPTPDARPGHSSSGDGAVTPDGYVVNTAFSVNQPHPAHVPASYLVPEQTMPTIGDRLSERGISWAWYSGGWDDALAGHPDPLFQFHHQPFAYFADLADGTAAKAEHLKDEKDFMAAIKQGTLPAVAFVKPLGPDNEHPGYAALTRGQRHVAAIVDAIRHSPLWKSTAIIITYDEHGGRWDHVAPPIVDRWGPGSRVPAIIVSPYAKRHFIDHTEYDTTSILRFIESRWDLKPLTARDAHAHNLLNAFDFSQQP
ncbi:MAG TPA: acid phosphatase [Mariprofundaceae bacterium]|nr:acid phosphatase [Mariprofundaceae bacterium]